MTDTTPAGPPRKARWRTLAIVAVLFLAPLAWAWMAPFGGWVQSWFAGSGVRWSEAYAALDTAEARRPPDRLSIANAMVDGPPPVGMVVGPRLHPRGTLAHLRYETFGHDGALLDTWDVRALVPNIGNGVGPFWRERCSRSCRAEVAQSAGFRVRRSGDPGIAEEWVLRMPVGQAFDLVRQPLTTQDILDARGRTTAMGSVKVDGQWLPNPARIRVTLVEACNGIVRVGTIMELEFMAHMPIPKGFATSRWAQLDGCGKLKPLPDPTQASIARAGHSSRDTSEAQVAIVAEDPSSPRLTPAPRTAAAPAAGAPATAPPSVSGPASAVAVTPAAGPVSGANSPQELRALVPRREKGTGHASLVVSEAWLRQHGADVMVKVQRVCRYDPAENRWQVVSPVQPQTRWRVAPSSDPGERVVYALPHEIALFWVRWYERPADDRQGERIRYRDVQMVSGPVVCNDLMIGPAPAGSVAACVPFAVRAEARFVPVPAGGC